MLVWVYVSVGRGAELSKTRDLLLLRAEFGVTLCLDIMARWQVTRSSRECGVCDSVGRGVELSKTRGLLLLRGLGDCLVLCCCCGKYTN